MLGLWSESRWAEPRVHALWCCVITLVPESEIESGKSGNTRLKMVLEGYIFQISHYRDGNTELPKANSRVQSVL